MRFQESVNSLFSHSPRDVLTTPAISRTTVAVIVRGSRRREYYATRSVMYARHACALHAYYTRKYTAVRQAAH